MVKNGQLYPGPQRVNVINYTIDIVLCYVRLLSRFSLV